MEDKKCNIIKISGVVECDSETTQDMFVDEFILWIESKGWSFGGGFEPCKEDE